MVDNHWESISVGASQMKWLVLVCTYYSSICFLVRLRDLLALQSAILFDSIKGAFFSDVLGLVLLDEVSIRFHPPEPPRSGE